MTEEKATATAVQEAVKLNDLGLEYYGQWELDNAVNSFTDAVNHDPLNPEYHLNLARAFARAGNYPEAMQSLADYLHVETDESLSDRYERLFSSALDGVELSVIEGMQSMNMPVQLIGKAIQMWLEYRLTLGRQPILLMEQPEVWASAITFLTCKINFQETDREQIVTLYDVEPQKMKDHCNLLIETLDLIAADYRYFIGEQNPLDEVFEAAQKMDKLYSGFELD